ncbi:MAG TPA: DUF4893 domain-containing protein [Allosphingosinicella sp.]|nr:DUF4893 domain-containing protein [Allosphingosinicella sp.]
MRSACPLQSPAAAASLPDLTRAPRRAGWALGGLSFLLLLAACQTRPSPDLEAAASVEVVQEPAWRSSASASDAARIDGLAAAWNEALANARRRGFARQVSAEGPLLEPNAALPRPAPTPGSYMCRWIRFGSGEARSRAFTTFQPFFCHVGASDDDLSLTKQTGSDRPSGYLFEDSTPRRMIFLGSLALGNETEPVAYGEDPERDMAGIFERVGPLRFRLVVPRPRTGSTLEVLELIPAAIQNTE